MAEIKRSLKSLKNGKAAGCDNIPPEAWKEGGMVSTKVLHSPLNKIWNEEDIPQDWKVGLVVKLPKKRDLCLCKNWRGIMLLTVTSKGEMTGSFNMNTGVLPYGTRLGISTSFW